MLFSENKRRHWVLSILLMVISLTTTCTAVLLLYRVAFEECREDMLVMAQSQARLIEAVAEHDRATSHLIRDELPDYDPVEASLQKVIHAHETFSGFGETGEFILAQKLDDKIVFRFRPRADSVSKPESIPFNSKLAEPMRRALSGFSGSMVGIDYRGKLVLAAYEPVRNLNLGIVAKLDLAEVRQPFVTAALISFVLTFALIVVGVLVIRRTIAPLFDGMRATTEELASEMQQHKQALAALKESEMRFRQISDVAEDVFWLVDCENPEKTKVLYVNQAFEKLWQRPVADLKRDPTVWAEALHPDDREMIENSRLSFLRGEGSFDHEFRLCLADGGIRHIWAKGGLIRDDAGKIVRAAGLAHDISAIKAAEKMVQESTQTLEMKVAERTEELRKTIKLMTGREIRMAELKKEIAQLQEKLQQVKEG